MGEKVTVIINGEEVVVDEMKPIREVVTGLPAVRGNENVLSMKGRNLPASQSQKIEADPFPNLPIVGYGRG